MQRPAIIAGLAGLAILLAVILLYRGAGTPEPASQPVASAERRAPTPLSEAPSPEPPAPSGREPGSEGPAPITEPAAPNPQPLIIGDAPVPEQVEEEEEDNPDAPVQNTVWSATKEGIQGAMAEALPGIRRCYEQALEVHPDMAGKIVVAFSIGTKDTAAGVGQVLDAGIADATIEQTTMDDCLLDAMEDLQFDPPVDGEMEINYPFHFSTE